ncbi:MAG: N-6 DNA methylase [Phycisphaerales bacterium]|nr:N-6 DNA methylase [Phycisphaerales bacterium]
MALAASDFKEETAAVPPSVQSAASLKPLLEECGYTGARLQTKYTMGDVEIPLVGFATRERDMDSACIAVVDGGSDPIAAVRSCYELAAPVVWVRHNGSVDWWIQKQNTPVRFQSTPVGQFAALVRQYKDQLDPISIYQGRTLARINPAKQLDFVDAGLLPLRREEAGKKLHDTVESMIAATLKAMRRSKPSKDTLRDVFTSVFRMLAGKILKDKGIGEFPSVDLSKPKAVLHAVAAHYDTTNKKPEPPLSGYDVLKDAATLLSQAGSFAVVSPESLAYVYEHTLVTKHLRKKLGIHATPPWLVDYMVWQLYDWVREIPVDDRHVFEPACGHAPFLLSMMRLLRMEMHGKTDKAVHAYLKEHIHGVEIDDFAREIARLSLTLADIPNPNGWDLQSGDMFASAVLSTVAKSARIFLSNPPYEAFTEKQRRDYGQHGEPITATTKAVEMLKRTLPNLPPGGVFGVVMPVGVLHDKETKTVREQLLKEFDLSEINVFADNLFEHGDHEVAVLMGRRKMPGRKPPVLMYRRVREGGMAAFKERLAFSWEQEVLLSRFASTKDNELRVPELDEVWQNLAGNQHLSRIAFVGQGFSFEGQDLPEGTETLVAKPRKGFKPCFVTARGDIPIYELPERMWMNPGADAIQRPRAGVDGKPDQVIVNHARSSRGAWTMKAWLDRDGCAVKGNFLVVRSTEARVSGTVLWALLNSPLANGFVFSRATKRHIIGGDLLEMPLPALGDVQIEHIEAAARKYLDSTQRLNVALVDEETRIDVKQALLEMDAAVLRAYALPVRLERQLLDLFNGAERKGVGCSFGDYYPATFKSLVPLHKYISAGYRGSTVDQVAARMKPGGSATVTAALRAAAEAFGGDD